MAKEQYLDINGAELLWDRTKGQINELKSDLGEIKEATTNLIEPQNKIDLTKKTENKNILANGELTDNSSFNTSDYIYAVGHSKAFFARKNSSGVFFGDGYGYISQYKNDKTFISRIHGVNPVVLDSECAFIRVSWNKTDTFVELAFDIDTISESELTDYFTPYPLMKKDESVETLKINTIYPINYIDINKMINGKQIAYDGTITNNSSQIVSDFSEVKPNTDIILAYSNQYGEITFSAVYVAQYNANKMFISRVSGNNVIHLADNCKYIRASFGNTANLYGAFDSSLNTKITVADFFKYYDPYTGSETINNELKEAIETVTEHYPTFKTKGIKLPIPCGKRTNIYFDNLLYGNKNKYLGVTNVNKKGIEREDSIFVSPTNNDSYNILNLFGVKNTGVQAYFGDDCSVNVQLIRTDLNAGHSVKALLIGDSYTGMGQYQKYANDLLTENGINVTWLGTQFGLESNLKHEGRGGWRAYTYTHFASVPSGSSEGVESINPFYNTTSNNFDFSYYMTQNNYSSVDVVFINLGINDTGKDNNIDAETIKNSWQTIIDSIHAYNQNIKIVLWLPTMPCIMQGVTFDFENYQNRMKMHNIIIDNFCGDVWGYNNIYVIPTYLVTDPIYDYPYEEINKDEYNSYKIKVPTDTIHLNENGMHKLGNIIGAMLQYLS